jgi:DNA-binding NarL/FixJ family response regulator
MSDTPTTRIMLVDDHTLVRSGVRRILESQPGLEVCAEFDDGHAAIAALGTTAPDVLVLDLTMPAMDGFEVLRRAKRARPELKVLVLTMHANPEYVQRAITEGADGYLLKDSAVQDLVAGVEAVNEGRAYYSPQIQAQLAEILRTGRESEPRPLGTLTEREREVLRLVAEGLATKEIAARFDISARTVETHRANIMRKLDLHSVARLTQFAIREGLVAAP